MISRGYFIGEIVDELANISNQVETRCKLGLTDLNKFLEIFFRDYINIACGYNLTDANEDRSNEPGIDLIDEASSIAIQVTSQKASSKINDTLEQCIRNEITDKRIIVLVIGNKQNSYTLNEEFVEQTAFNVEKNIWDTNTLSKLAIDLKIDSLQELHSLMKKNIAKISIELEIPDEQGNYKTTLFDKLEATAKPKIGDLKNILEYEKCQSGEDTTEEFRNDLEKSVIKLVKKLRKLPRVTREFFAIIFEKSELNTKPITPSLSIPYTKLKHIIYNHNINDEIELLDYYGLANVYFPESTEEDVAEVSINNTYKSDYFIPLLWQFLKEKKLSPRNILVNIDFSEL